jgi:hypothetical protein
MKIPRTAFAMMLASLAWCAPAQAGDIHDAAESGDLAKLGALLKQDPSLVNAPGTNGMTPLFYAVAQGHIEAVALLLENKADVNHKARYGGTPLYFATFYDRKDMVELLLSQGADPDPRDKDGWTPLGLAEDRGYSDIVAVLRQHGAVVAGEPAIRQWMFEESGVAVPGEKVCKDDGIWVRAWQSVRQDLPRHLKPGQQGVVIFLGQCPTGGYKAEVLSAEAEGPVCMVRYKVTTPTGFVTEVLTTPCLFAIVSPAGLPVKFTRQLDGGTSPVNSRD